MPAELAAPIPNAGVVAVPKLSPPEAAGAPNVVAAALDAAAGVPKEKPPPAGARTLRRNGATQALSRPARDPAAYLMTLRMRVLKQHQNQPLSCRLHAKNTKSDG